MASQIFQQLARQTSSSLDVACVLSSTALSTSCHTFPSTLADIQKEAIKIAKIEEEKTQGHGLPSNFNPRANMWRRISSRASVPVFVALSPMEEKMFMWPDTFTQTN